MGGGKSTTLLIAKYFCHLANALVITISGQINGSDGLRAFAHSQD